MQNAQSVMTGKISVFEFCIFRPRGVSLCLSFRLAFYTIKRNEPKIEKLTIQKIFNPRQISTFDLEMCQALERIQLMNQISKTKLFPV